MTTTDHTDHHRADHPGANHTGTNHAEAAAAGPAPLAAGVYDDRPPRDQERPSAARLRWLIAGTAVAAVAVAGGVVVAASGSDDGDEAAEPLTVRTETATVVDLVEFTDLDGTLGYASTSTASPAADGLLTDLPVTGSTLERGDIAFAIDGRPTVVFHGDVPLYRELTDGVEGDDVLLLEENLAALGYHVAEVDDDGNPVDEGFVVDGVFDEATTDAVERWQDDLGVERTGIVVPSDVVMLAGPSEITDVTAEIGHRTNPGAPLLSLNQSAELTAGPAAAGGGEIEVFVTTGQQLASGDIVYAIDGEPLTAVVTDVEIDRDLVDGVDPGDDVLAVEEMLVALGYDAGGDLIVDDIFADATETAIDDWQTDLANTFDGVDVDGRIDVEDLLVLDPGTVVGDLTLGESDTVVASGTLLWTTTAPTTERIVTTAIPVTDQDQVPIGADVTVELPDGEQVSAVVTHVATTTTVDPTNPEAAPELAVELVLSTVPESIEGFAELDVTVKLVDEMATGVTAVPASALVATGDGGYAVEVVDGGTTTFVAVEPGMFDDGMVEVDGIAPGTDVVVAS